MCSGKLDPPYRLFSHLSRALVFSQGNFTVSWCVLLFSSAQSDVYAGLNTDLSIDFQPHRKKGAAVQKHWVGLINTYWLCWADCFFLGCSFVFSLHMKCMKVKSWPGTFVLTRLNKLGINEWEWSCISWNNQHGRPPPFLMAELDPDTKAWTRKHKWERERTCSFTCRRTIAQGCCDNWLQQRRGHLPELVANDYRIPGRCSQWQRHSQPTSFQKWNKTHWKASQVDR